MEGVRLSMGSMSLLMAAAAAFTPLQSPSMRMHPLHPRFRIAACQEEEVPSFAAPPPGFECDDEDECELPPLEEEDEVPSFAAPPPGYECDDDDECELPGLEEEDTAEATATRIHESPQARTRVLQMVSSWYDSGGRLDQAEPQGGSTAAEAVTTSPAEADADADALAAEDACLSNVEAVDECALPNPTATLQRYLQLRAVLNGEPLPDAVVEGLITKVEQEAHPVTFSEERIWGEWQLCWQRSTKEATNSQRALAPLPQFSNFLTDSTGVNVFRNVVKLTKQRVSVIADVAYTPPALEGVKSTLFTATVKRGAEGDREDGGSSGGGAANRLESTIRAARVEVALGQRWGWAPLRLPLPLRGTGWLDVTYLSNEMRITRGNRGGIFVHLRPALLTRQAAEA